MSVSSTASQTRKGGTKPASPLVSACRYLLQPNGSINGDNVAKAILPNFPDLCSALPVDCFANRQALLGIDDRRPLTHARIRDFILKELGPQLHEMGYGRGDRIALVLPNGPELGLAILGIAQWASCLPMNANGASSELRKDLHAAKAALVIGMADDSAAIQDMARGLDIPFCGLKPSEYEVGVFSLLPMTAYTAKFSFKLELGKSDELCCTTDPVCSGGDANAIFATNSMDRHHRFKGHKYLSNDHNNEVLVLFTSGTTGNKKLVPHKLGDMLIAAAVIAVSWNLSPEDVNCNLMPLFHVGGIVRQIFAPILSAGSVICCPAFDPQAFWALIQKDPPFTWYYAAPTMHQVILSSMPSGVKPKLRMIANAAGGLLPSLAHELRNVFGANVLPSYGMTECMPISSPPANYQLQKPGTSGVAVGPQITIFSSNFEILPHGMEGNICVRGRPCFHGYGGQPQEESFLEGGWFNTGDLGYLDEDGYLYITGRSKEVINRGGEIISPLEVEEEVSQHPQVSACLAFATNHDVLQEIVGIVIIPKLNVPRVDLPTLHAFLQERLTPAKWPQCMVYMDALPKSHTNKLLRVKLGQRLNLPAMSDSLYPVERTFEATCPPQGTVVGVSIPCEAVSVDTDFIQEILQQELGAVDDTYVVDLLNGDHEEVPPPKSRQLLVTPHSTKIGGVVVHVSNLERVEVIKKAKTCLDAYLQPSHVIEYKKSITPDTLKKVPDTTDAVSFIMQTSILISDPMVQELQELIQELIDLDCMPAPDTNFFQIGGSSLLASQLASKLRKKYSVCLSGADIFRHNSCLTMAKKIQSQKPEYRGRNTSIFETSNNSMTNNQDQSGSSCVDLQGVPLESRRLEPQNSFLSALFQLLPLFGVFPLWQFTRFFLFFMSLLGMLHHTPGGHNIWKFIGTLVSYHFAWNLITPLVFVLIKWIVIGRYKKGRYACFSWYYLRWWFVDVLRKQFGKGVWGSHPELLALYYRLLGATIGSNTHISLEADIAEFDLVTIGDNTKIEYASVRGFGLDNGAMILGPVIVGDSSSVGIRSIVAPYTRVPSGTHVGPASSSYEISQDDIHLSYNRYTVPEPNFCMRTFVATPIIFLVDTFSHIPAMYVLYLMVTMHSNQAEGFYNIGDLMEWLCHPKRIPYYMGVRIVRHLVAPFFYTFAAILVKWTVIGKFKPGPRDLTSQWQLTRHYMAASMFSRENMQEVTDLLGRHYEPISVLYRLLGAKVGKRVFWPGNQPVFSGEFDLLAIGDDVVFGSRTAFICSTTDSLEKIVFCAGSNISDNTVVLPGSIIGRNAVLGSNTVCPVGRYLPEASIWLGSHAGEPTMLEPGTEENVKEVMFSSEVKESDLPMIGDEHTLRPFGTAVYHREATYFVWPVSMMMMYKYVCVILFETLHALPLLLALHCAGAFIYGVSFENRLYDEIEVTPFRLYYTAFSFFLVTHALRVMFCLAIEIGAKWAYLGRRVEGRYNWLVFFRMLFIAFYYS
jgi:acyl-CoA synthetase (AMP-forming)/AMP-acid ligase II/acetyltransferase-like isoleucine patch superfamily enzyme